MMMITQVMQGYTKKMKLINADKLMTIDANEVDLRPYVILAKQVREAQEVKAIPMEYIESLMKWISARHPNGIKADQYLILLALKKAYSVDWRPWE